MNIVIYARYSSHSQTEQSIEGQLQTCYDYAKNNGHTVIGKYIDQAQSGTSDSRAEFQRMIADSDRHTFEAVLVYQLDRFAHNRYDSAINKAKLKKNGVRVISARENISDDASGILVEGVLESMAEYYSAELSQKIRRGMDINAEKCLSNGSNPSLGYYVDKERRFHIDPEGATTVREIFELYARGKTVAEIITYLNGKQVKTSLGKAFNTNSLHRLLRNKRYIGYYIYKDTETPGVMPRIIEDELFERVQHILNNKKVPTALQLPLPLTHEGWGCFFSLIFHNTLMNRNTLQTLFIDHYEEILYTIHPRPSVIENIDKMINCGYPAFGGAMYGCPKCGNL